MSFKIDHNFVHPPRFQQYILFTYPGVVFIFPSYFPFIFYFHTPFHFHYVELIFISFTKLYPSSSSAIKANFCLFCSELCQVLKLRLYSLSFYVSMLIFFTYFVSKSFPIPYLAII